MPCVNNNPQAYLIDIQTKSAHFASSEPLYRPSLRLTGLAWRCSSAGGQSQFDTQDGHLDAWAHLSVISCWGQSPGDFLLHPQNLKRIVAGAPVCAAAVCMECPVLSPGKEGRVVNIHLLLCNLFCLDPDQEQKWTSTKKQLKDKHRPPVRVEERESLLPLACSHEAATVTGCTPVSLLSMTSLLKIPNTTPLSMCCGEKVFQKSSGLIPPHSKSNRDWSIHLSLWNQNAQPGVDAVLHAILSGST